MDILAGSRPVLLAPRGQRARALPAVRLLCGLGPVAPGCLLLPQFLACEVGPGLRQDSGTLAPSSCPRRFPSASGQAPRWRRRWEWERGHRQVGQGGRGRGAGPQEPLGKDGGSVLGRGDVEGRGQEGGEHGPWPPGPPGTHRSNSRAVGGARAHSLGCGGAGEPGPRGIFGKSLSPAVAPT